MLVYEFNMNTKSNANKNRKKIFHTIQSKLALIGFEKNLRPFNVRQNWTIIMASISLTTLVIYPLHLATTPKEYMDSIFVCGVGSLVTISHFSIIPKTETVFTFIDEIEQVNIFKSKKQRILFLNNFTRFCAQVPNESEF